MKKCTMQRQEDLLSSLFCSAPRRCRGRKGWGPTTAAEEQRLWIPTHKLCEKGFTLSLKGGWWYKTAGKQKSNKGAEGLRGNGKLL